MTRGLSAAAVVAVMLGAQADLARAQRTPERIPPVDAPPHEPEQTPEPEQPPPDSDGETPPDGQQEQPTVIDVTSLSKVPVQTKYVEAEYPPEALEKGIETDVVLLLDIDDKGFVGSVGLAQPVDPPDMGFDVAAMVAAQSFEFSPAEVDGKPIAVQVTYTYRFRLPKEETPEETPEDPKNPKNPKNPNDPNLTTGSGTEPTEVDKPPVQEPPGVVNFAGRLIERGTRSPMPGVVVTVFREDLGQPIGFEATTDARGDFEFYDLAAGNWKVLVDAPGYYPYRTNEDIVAGERVDTVYHVEKGTYNPYDVTVTAERPRKEVSRTVISADQIDLVPGGAGDPLAVIENFAGVARTFPGILVIRGSAPEDSRIFVDGITIPLIYHFGGIKSVIPIGVLDSIEFYPGNFSPFYGRATGGIVDVRIKEIKPEKIGGYADVSILDTGLFLKMPLGDKGGIAVAGRRSYVDFILKAAIPDDAGVSFRTAPRYYDFQLVGSYRPTPAHDIRWFGLASDDRLRLLFDDPAELDAGLEDNEFSNVFTFQRFQVIHRYVPDKTVENEIRVSIGKDNFDARIDPLFFDINLFTAQVRDNFRYRWSDKWALTVGTDIEFAVVDLLINLPLPPNEGEPNSMDGPNDIEDLVQTNVQGAVRINPAVYAEGELSPIDGLRVFPGLRLEYFQRTDRYEASPRLTARYQISKPVTIKGGVGLFVQQPNFNETNEDFGNPDLDTEKAIHYSAGAEYKPVSWLTLDGVAFYKDLFDVVSPTEELVMRDGMVRPKIFDNDGEGQVYGVELQAKHDFSHNLTGWLAYTLSRAKRTDSGSSESRLFDFDQTHILSLVASYSLPRNWTLGGRFRLVSGNPNTPVVGSVYNGTTDQYDPIFGAVNSGRNGAFNQLDLRVDKRWIYENWILNAYLDIQNVYNRQNPEGIEYNFDFTQQRAFTGLPILTIIGLRGEF